MLLDADYVTSKGPEEAFGPSLGLDQGLESIDVECTDAEIHSIDRLIDSVSGIGQVRS